MAGLAYTSDDASGMAEVDAEAFPATAELKRYLQLHRSRGAATPSSLTLPAASTSSNANASVIANGSWRAGANLSAGRSMYGGNSSATTTTRHRTPHTALSAEISRAL